MSKSNEFASDILFLLFNNVAITNFGDAGGILATAGAGNLYLSLHTSDPGEAVTDPTATETGYENYLRQAIARASGAGGFTVTGADPDPATVSPTDDTDFPEAGATAPGGPITHFAITAGIDGTGDELVLYSGTVTPNITMAEGVIPRIKSTSAITED